VRDGEPPSFFFLRPEVPRQIFSSPRPRSARRSLIDHPFRFVGFLNSPLKFFLKTTLPSFRCVGFLLQTALLPSLAIWLLKAGKSRRGFTSAPLRAAPFPPGGGPQVIPPMSRTCLAGRYLRPYIRSPSGRFASLRLFPPTKKTAVRAIFLFFRGPQPLSSVSVLSPHYTVSQGFRLPRYSFFKCSDALT